MLFRKKFPSVEAHLFLLRKISVINHSFRVMSRASGSFVIKQFDNDIISSGDVLGVAHGDSPNASLVARKRNIEFKTIVSLS